MFNLVSSKTTSRTDLDADFLEERHETSLYKKPRGQQIPHGGVQQSVPQMAIAAMENDVSVSSSQLEMFAWK